MPSYPTSFAVAAVFMLAVASVTPASAEDSWNPFKNKELTPREKRRAVPEPEKAPALPPMGGLGTEPWRPAPAGARGLNPRDIEPAPGDVDAAGRRDLPAPGTFSVERQALPALDERSRAVDRGDLQPVMTNDGRGLPVEFWQGVDLKAIEQALGQLEIPPRSPSLTQLWRRIWTANAEAPSGSGDKEHFEALRVEALFRSGMIGEVQARLQAIGGEGGANPLLSAVLARLHVGLGDRESGCRLARQVARGGDAIPKAMKAEMLLLTAYCAAADGNIDAAALALDLARADATPKSFAVAALDSVVAGQPFKPATPKQLTLLDYRYLQVAKATPTAELLGTSEPALLAVLGSDPATEPGLRIVAAEAAARINALDAAGLIDAYRTTAAPAGGGGDPLTSREDPNHRRAQLFKAVEAERTPMRKARLARALLDEARRARLGMTIASAMSRAIEGIVPAQEIGWFAETAIEIHLSAGNLAGARRWLDFSARDRGDGLQHWLLLIDLADAERGGARDAGFPAVEQMAVRGKLSSDLLHRLATVLDALDYQIPIPLWEAASRSPQPTTGYLPETGVLSQLQDAAKRKELARTVLLAMRAIGPASAEGAHVIALGDAIRALRRAGLEADARKLALEAVIGGWPRMAVN